MRVLLGGGGRTAGPVLVALLASTPGAAAQGGSAGDFVPREWPGPSGAAARSAEPWVGPAATQESGPPEPPGAPTPHAAPRARVVFAPDADFYPTYIADPHRSTLSLKSVHLTDSTIPGAGDTRLGILAGQRFGVVRLHPEGRPDVGWQVDGELTIVAQFDRDDSEDNIGWDGLFGFRAARRYGSGFTWSAGFTHDSAHLGDEFIEETGRQRLNYTREELNAGAVLPFGETWQAYTEAGWTYHRGNNDLQDHWRVQGGLQVEPPPAWWEGLAGWYAALDVSAYEENDWDANVTIQAGVALHPDRGGVWRVGLELYDGRSPLGEFFQEEETHFAIGFWIDL